MSDDRIFLDGTERSKEWGGMGRREEAEWKRQQVAEARTEAEAAADALEYYDEARSCEKCGWIQMDTTLMTVAHKFDGWKLPTGYGYPKDAPRVELILRNCRRCGHERFEQPLDRKGSE